MPVIRYPEEAEQDHDDGYPPQPVEGRNAFHCEPRRELRARQVYSVAAAVNHLSPGNAAGIRSTGLAWMHACQHRLKFPHFAGRKFPPCWRGRFTVPAGWREDSAGGRSGGGLCWRATRRGITSCAFAVCWLAENRKNRSQSVWRGVPVPIHRRAKSPGHLDRKRPFFRVTQVILTAHLCKAA